MEVSQLLVNLKEFWSDKRILFLSCVFIISLVTIIVSQSKGETWIVFVMGAFSFVLIEYITHRFVLHGILSRIMPKAYQSHDYHHNHPNDIKFLLTPNAYNIPSYLFVAVLTCTVSQSLHFGGEFLLGLSLYQLYYEWVHFISHRPIHPVTPWGKWMKKYHLLHHFKNTQNYFGVTNPALDMIVGTYDSVAKVKSEKRNKNVQQ
jgi:4-hydroxysphinganine ceramide fatty acyl 2-hydroxylase